TEESRARILANPNIDFVETRNGGHCAFLGRRSTDVHWAEATVVRYLQAVTSDTRGCSGVSPGATSQLQ
ncbi:MAG: hypothetical protein ACP5EP_13270, partial [Acidobacteriaceae bacterium]